MKNELPAPVLQRIDRRLSALPSVYRNLLDRFVRDLSAAEKEISDYAPGRHDLASDDDCWEVPNVARYAMAVQLFCGLTAEAVVNSYVVLKFGGAEFDKHFRNMNIFNRLRAGLPSAVAAPRDSELMATLERIMQRRDKIAHPIVPEYAADWAREPSRPFPSVSPATARSAVTDLNKFLAELRRLDPTDAMHVHP